MKSIVCDHVRRWWWVWLASLGVCILTVGVGQPLKPDFSNLFFFPLTMYIGVALLSYDLTKGDVPRVLRTLPVSAREVGQAWWWASVGLPGLTLALLTGFIWLFLVLTRHPVSGLACFNYGLTNALLFGPNFYLFAGTPPPGAKDWGTGLRGLVNGILFGVFFLGLLYFYKFFPPQTMQWNIFIVVASILTVASWLRAEAFARNRLGATLTIADQQFGMARVQQVVEQRLHTILRPLTGGRTGSALGPHAPGGLRLLFQTLFYPAFGLGLTTVLIFGLLLFRSHAPDVDQDFAGIFWTMLSIFLWVVELTVMPRALLQIRWLRTLPVSAPQLAGVILFAPVTAMVAFMVLGNLILGIIYPIPQMSFLAMLREGCLLQIALTTVVVPLILWRGLDALVLALVLGLMTGCVLSSFYIQSHLSLTANVILALVIMGASFLTTIWLWNAVSRPYRARASQLKSWFGEAG